MNILIGGEYNHPERLAAGRQLLRAAERGQFEVYISALTIAEVSGSGGVRGTNVPPVLRAANVAAARTWISDGAFRVVELDPSLAADAGEWAISHQLKGPDAVSSASAVRAHVGTLFTWDDDLLKMDGVVDGLRVIPPTEATLTQDLFDAAEH
ncbi:MAG: PIN domain-containing protein [Actinobacteria bacterium]|nr:PIN domain-containing protein [Actinomycetota bacterium]